MTKYEIVGKFHMGAIGESVELPEAEGDGWVNLGRLEKVTTKPKPKPRQTRKKANG